MQYNLGVIRDILHARDPRLRVVSKPVRVVDKKIHDIIIDLKDTLVVQKDPEGVGLAAPQIGKNVRVFVAKTPKEIKVVINPKVLEIIKGQPKKKKRGKKIMEGCLSLVNFYGPLKRPGKIKLGYTTEEGKEKVETFTGFAAQIIQHEIDHLNGILFVDRLIEQKKSLFELVNGEWEKVELV